MIDKSKKTLRIPGIKNTNDARHDLGGSSWMLIN
jgi:hypothetical protein